MAAHPITMKIVRVLHRLYKATLSKVFGNACRFHPYCSDYSVEAIEKYGILKGVWMGAKRLMRCHPLSKGGFDPVP